MRELIERQAAIDVIEAGRLTKLIDAESAVNGLKNLPTVQPEQPIIKCKDCKWWKKQKDSAQGRCRLLGIYPTGAWYCANGAEERTDG